MAILFVLLSSQGDADLLFMVPLVLLFVVRSVQPIHVVWCADFEKCVLVEGSLASHYVQALLGSTSIQQPIDYRKSGWTGP